MNCSAWHINNYLSYVLSAMATFAVCAASGNPFILLLRA
ncbi:hypothetical protein NP493_258g03001 [Ridgeia piscesae]|uniref:Uncharacterized protein n=1 Tax=Ridgeia piscesae TaxID=27915 RepID=A0AAD9NY26_RIDPI|nr:hypothetical protein NP493_258g03001 [Ridgeia piscesae]